MFMQAIAAQKRHQNANHTKQHRLSVTDEEKATIHELTREGYGVKDIADTLGLAYSTVYNHKRQAQRRVNADD